MEPPGTYIRVFHPHPFEIALIRKLEAKTKSIHDAFLFLDIDCDGRVSPSDIRTVLHNEFEIDVTKEQEECIFSHASLNGDAAGMKYAEFAIYFSEVSNTSSYPMSESGSAAAVGFRKDADIVDKEAPIHIQPRTKRMNLRHQLRQLLTSHSSRSPAKSGSAMKETSLFLAMDVHRSGKVTMEEFLDWLNEVGNLEWSMEDLKLIVLGTSDTDKEGKEDWFSSNESNNMEAGMTEHEFAIFVESLDMDSDDGKVAG
jgi:Ca2+-binding EF-hand superfamily protein